MYSDFLKFFNRSIGYNIYGNDYRTFIIAFGGHRFGKGMFSVFDKSEALFMERTLAKVFPERKGSFRLFGYDWMGRCFAVPADNEDKIFVFDPGVLDVYEIPLDLRDFVNKAIPVTTEECLSADAFIKWQEACGSELKGLECAGYKVPLFLGGIDELDNFEKIDLMEYWQFIVQAGRKFRGIEDEEKPVPEPAEVDDTAEDFYEEEIEEDMSEEDAYYAQQADEAGDFFEHQKKRALYIKRNVDKYLDKFKKMYQNDTNVSWNWCAFLFGGAWFLYRKMYKTFILVYLISAVCGGLLGYGLGFGLGKAGFGMGEITFFVAIAAIALSIVVMIVVGMFSNHWYSKKIDKLVAIGEEAQTDEDWEKALKKGGINIPLMIVYIVLIAVAAVPYLFL